MAFADHARTRADVPGTEGGARPGGADDGGSAMDEVAALVRRAERAGIDPRRVIAALGLDLQFFPDVDAGENADRDAVNPSAEGCRKLAWRARRSGSR